MYSNKISDVYIYVVFFLGSGRTKTSVIRITCISTIPIGTISPFIFSKFMYYTLGQTQLVDRIGDVLFCRCVIPIRVI